MLTSFAFGKVENQYQLCEKFPAPLTEVDRDVFRTQSGYTVSKDYCSCPFFKAMKLPCRHIFKLMESQSLDLFMPTVCLYRWTKQCYNKSHPALSAYKEVLAPQPISVQKMKVPDEVNKYKKASTITKQINDGVSTLTPDRYNHYIEKLAKLRDEIFEPNDESEDYQNCTPRTSIESHPTFGVAVESSSTNNCIAGLPEIDSNIRTVAAANTNNDDREAGASAQLQNNSRNDIGRIRMPPKIASVGRPKGKKNTAIGVKRKSNGGDEATPAKIKFLDLNSKNQSLTILSWLTNKTVTQIFSKKISTDEIIQDAARFNRLRNDAVNISDTKKYFDRKTYEYLCDEIEKLDGKPWCCVKCNRNLSGDQIMCHSCLDWYHVKCVNYSQPKGNSNFFCNDCKRISPLITL